MAPNKSVYVIGVGMTKFEKPGRRESFDYPDMVKESVTKALVDAGITYDSIESAYVGYVYGDSTGGQRALYQFGLTQIPIVNVNNNCSTGSTALWLAKQQISTGSAECVLAVGFEKMSRGSLKSVYSDRANPLDQFVEVMAETRGVTSSPVAPQLFGNAGIEYCEKYGAKPEHMAKIAEKNRRHSVLNPYSQFQEACSLDSIRRSREVSGPLTMLQCCPTSDGSGAVVLASEEFVKKHELQNQAIHLVAQELVTDSPKAFNSSSIELVGFDMTRAAAQRVYRQANIKPSDIQVVELHDCFSANELITYDALGLSSPGKAHELVDSKDNTYGGKHVVNPSGGLISKGHPLGATGLAQCCELTWQLRGWCEKRQVPKLRYALQHNIGLGGAVVVGLYKRPDFGTKEDPKTRLGYNPAVECRGITQEEYLKVISKQNRPSKL
ncbi:thiolase [Basidiobolus meristosporus CBS 931.73]|uniref:propanoyl-CoA C-acyltransferase n=1 Tax=Basidiobolus meristosporus CBS 931.73 TaxID=1314790 RepID=A0A1Y1X9E7_9FUNG|nr:thiolase [Basidiobolus meristosporus CBS 931.73]|eukprot:ORX81954.1 thiolase [Basidiobolus meristosporus CBS 931.73]